MDQTLTSDFAAFPRICVGQSQSAPVVPAGFDQFASEFEAATGWVLRFDENQSSRNRRESSAADSIPVGKISICDMSAAWPAGKNTASRQRCDRLAERISQIFEERQSALLKLNEAESSGAQLNLSSLPTATSKARKSREENLADFVQGLLDSCMQLSGTEAAAVCLIDDESKNLSTQYTRGNINLQGLVRPLPNCPADVEALCGSAIVMADSESVKTWHSPTDCQSAVCLPVSSSTTLLGTLWVFGSQEKDFDDGVLNLLEIVAGRVAVELELVVAWREFVAQEVAETVSSVSKIELPKTVENEAELSLALPLELGNETLVQPPFDGWEVEQVKADGFTKWAVTCDELVVALVASRVDSQQQIAIESVLDAVLSQLHCDASELLDSIRTLCGCDVDASIDFGCVVAVIDPLIGEVQLAQMGSCSEAVLSSCDGQLQTIYRNHACFMTRGQSLSLTCGSGDDKVCEASQLVFSRNK